LTADTLIEVEHGVKAIKLRRELDQLEREESAHELTNRVVTEAFGQFIDPLEFLSNDPTFGRPLSPVSLISDRAKGQRRGVFETEQELAAIRGLPPRTCMIHTSNTEKGIS